MTGKQHTTRVRVYNWSTDGIVYWNNSISNSQNSPERNSSAILWVVGGQTTSLGNHILFISFSSIITQTLSCWQDTKNNSKILFWFFFSELTRNKFYRMRPKSRKSRPPKSEKIKHPCTSPSSPKKTHENLPNEILTQSLNIWLSKN